MPHETITVENILCLALVFPLLTLNRQLFAGLNHTVCMLLLSIPQCNIAVYFLERKSNKERSFF